ncbi:MAG: SDR family oxidoreductase [Sphingomonas sp.]
MTELFDVAGKRVLITGGAQGLGRMIAEAFLRGGAHVTITSRTAETSHSAAEELGSLGDCTGLVADLSHADGAVALAGQIRARGMVLHALINNAGKSAGGPIESLADTSWPDLMSINVQSPFTLIRELLPMLRASATQDDPARIVNLGSFVGHAVPFRPTFSYGASKAALHHLTRMLAAELAPSHIAVNAIAPGYFPTRMTAAIDKAHMEDIPNHIPLGRLGRPDDIAGACIYLCSRAGAYLTGVILPVDGGLHGAR